MSHQFLSALLDSDCSSSLPPTQTVAYRTAVQRIRSIAATLNLALFAYHSENRVRVGAIGHEILIHSG